jgi:hypothetical protein
MVVRIVATVCWIGIGGIGVHMMRSPGFYEQWAAAPYQGVGPLSSLIDFGQGIVQSLGGIDTGRVMTIMGSFMIVGTWIKLVKPKKTEDVTGRQECARSEDKILLGEVPEEPVYEIRV